MTPVKIRFPDTSMDCSAKRRREDEGGEKRRYFARRGRRIRIDVAFLLEGDRRGEFG